MWHMEVGRVELGRPHANLPILMVRAQRQCAAERDRIQCMRRRWEQTVARCSHRSRTPAPALRQGERELSDSAADSGEIVSISANRRGRALLTTPPQSGELHGPNLGNVEHERQQPLVQTQ